MSLAVSNSSAMKAAENTDDDPGDPELAYGGHVQMEHSSDSCAA
jgi:hypothetical protein